MRIWKRSYFLWIMVAAAFVTGAMFLSRTVDTLPAAAFGDPTEDSVCLILDAGHGGEDGGAISCTGVNESVINLQITLRLNDFLHAIGRTTKMLRTEDVSLHTGQCHTISEKKVSDLKNRVKLVEETENGLLISIHQNQFSQAQYHGAQVFYAPSQGSSELAELLQDALSASIDPQNHRKCKPADSVYLLSKVHCPAVLVECGFLSNREEEALLRDADYQKKLAIVIGCTVSQYAQGMNTYES